MPVHRIAPDIIVAVGIVAALTAFLEPRMLVGGVVDHQIHQQTDAVFVQLPEQLLKIVQGAVFGCDIAIVGNVVTVVVSR